MCDTGCECEWGLCDWCGDYSICDMDNSCEWCRDYQCDCECDCEWCGDYSQCDTGCECDINCEYKCDWRNP